MKADRRIQKITGVRMICIFKLTDERLIDRCDQEDHSPHHVPFCY
jgi:hypothetical protein